MKIIGHRGVAGESFENSYSSFAKAYELNLELFEVDVQITKDGVPVIFHDEDLSRCTNMSGQISKFDYKFLNDFVLLKNGEKIPTLAELCDLNRDKPQKLILELKKPNSSEIVFNIIKKFDINQFIIASFFHKTIFDIKKINPSLSTSAIFECFPIDISNFVLATKCDSVSFGIESCDFEMVNEIKKINKECFAWTINTEFEYSFSKELGIDGIITNYPLAFLDNKS